MRFKLSDFEKKMIDYECFKHIYYQNLGIVFIFIWRPLSLSELTPIKFNTGLTHLGSDTSNLPIYIGYDFTTTIFQFYR